MRNYSQFRNYRENDYESGYEEVYCLQEGFYIRVLNLEILKKNSMALTFVGKHLLFCFKLKGVNTLASTSGTELLLTPLSAATYYFNEDTALIDSCDAGDYLMVMLVIDPLVMLGIPFSRESESLPALIRSIYDEDPDPVEFLHTFGIDLFNASSAIIGRKVVGYNERLFLKCKAVELLCLVFQEFLLMEANAHLNNLSAQDLRALQLVKDRIDCSLKDIPSIGKMSQEYDISESRLKAGFKSLFGLKIRAYILSSRIRKAQQMLMDKRTTIDRVAWELGYQHTSNFITAFKRHTGVTPKYYQEHFTASVVLKDRACD